MNPILFTESGNSENQDRAAVIPDGNRFVLVVADGAGGISGGSEAAQMAVDLICAATARLTTASACARVLQEADRAIASDPTAGETTCVVVAVSSGGIVGASVGDSGAWLIATNSFEDLTRLQTRKPLLGSGAARVAPFTLASHPMGSLLLATDGLLKYTSSERICEVCRRANFGVAPGSLVELVRLRSGNLSDDVTFVLTLLQASR